MSYRRKTYLTLPYLSEKDHEWMGAVKKDALLIFKMYIISIAQVTSRVDIVSPGHIFDLYGVGTNSEVSHGMLRIMSIGRSRSMYPGRMNGEYVTRALMVGRAPY